MLTIFKKITDELNCVRFFRRDLKLQSSIWQFKMPKSVLVFKLSCRPGAFWKFLVQAASMTPSSAIRALDRKKSAAFSNGFYSEGVQATTRGPIAARHQITIGRHKILKYSFISVYIVNFLQTLKGCLIMIGTMHSIITTIEGYVMDITNIGEQEIQTVLTHHCATYSERPGPLLVALYLALTAGSLDTPIV